MGADKNNFNREMLSEVMTSAHLRSRLSSTLLMIAEVRRKGREERLEQAQVWEKKGTILELWRFYTFEFELKVLEVNFYDPIQALAILSLWVAVTDLLNQRDFPNGNIWLSIVYTLISYIWWLVHSELIKAPVGIFILPHLIVIPLKSPKFRLGYKKYSSSITLQRKQKMLSFTLSHWCRSYFAQMSLR